jgi:hypothetical protein
MELKHGDLVRLKNWEPGLLATVHTAEGTGRDRGEKNPRRYAAEVAQVGHPIAWTVYAGRLEGLAAVGAKTIRDGELLTIEGREFFVRVRDDCQDKPRFSDPIGFNPGW